MEHLADEQIDLYVAGRLAEEREQELELHYLECPGCRARVTAVQDLAQGLRRGRRRSAAVPALAAALAAGLAALAVGGLWQGIARPLGSEPVRTALPRFTLQAPERGEETPRLQIPPEAQAVLLVLDASEAGPPGTGYDVSFLDGRGQVIATVRGLRSDAAGRVVVSLARNALPAGDYVARLASPGDVLRIPFQITAPTP